MTAWHHYSEVDACIEIRTKTDRSGEHVIDRFVVMAMTDDRGRHDPAVCPLTLLEARRIALELHASLEHLAEPLPQGWPRGHVRGLGRRLRR